MAKIIREADEIQRMINAVTSELDGLPDFDAFGGSNAGSRAEMRQWIEELRDALCVGLIVDQNSEVYHWLTEDKWSPLEDFLGG